MKKKVIVTGGAGFIGSHTCVALESAGYTPVIIDDFSNSEREVLPRLAEILGEAPTCHEADCGDVSAVRRILQEEGEVFGLIHFAAYKAVSASVATPLAYYRNNVGSLVAVLSALAEAGIPRFVFSSSCTVYGQPDQLPVTEGTVRKEAESPYGRSKQFCEDVIVDQVRSGARLSAATLRYFNPIGAHPSSLIGELPLGPPENLVPYITQTASGLRPALTIFGDDYPTPDGTCIRDYIHVLDLAEAHVKALEWIEGQGERSFVEVFNIGTGVGSSVLEAVRAFEKASGEPLNYRVGPRRPGDVVQTYADVTKAETTLGWKASRCLDDAMRDAYHWQKALDKRAGR